MTLKEGYDKIVEVRPIACPNKGFMVQLKKFELDLFGKNSEVSVDCTNYKLAHMVQKINAMKKYQGDKTSTENKSAQKELDDANE